MSVGLSGTVARDAMGLDWSLSASIENWQPVPFLTADSLMVTLSDAGIEFETMVDLLGIEGIRLVGDFLFESKTYAILATVPVNWTPVNQVNLSNVRFSIGNRNNDGSKGKTRIGASADLALFDTTFLVAANITADGFWLGATPAAGDWSPLPTVGFNFLLELPEYTQQLSLPRLIGASVEINPTTPIVAITVEDWIPFAVLGFDGFVVERGSVVIAPNGGSIGEKTFARGIQRRV